MTRSGKAVDVLFETEGLSLPIDWVTSTFGILAKRRAGKSNTAVVMAEDITDAGVPWVAIDPKGDWWGVRAAGTAPGLPVLVFGGKHADVPLEPTAGRVVARLIAEQRITCVLDVSRMIEPDRRRFLLDFATTLYDSNEEPLHVFCEEADQYIPQSSPKDYAEIIRAFSTLIKLGGGRGIGATLITQRSASLNNDVLTQIETLIALQTTGTPDREAIRKWVSYHEAGADSVLDIPKLGVGEAWVFSPAADIHQKVKFRRRRTFDSGETPKVGEAIRRPARLAEVDLSAIKAAMADTIERVEADDPARLRARIRELETARPAGEPTVEVRVEVKEVPVPVLTDDDIAKLLDQLAAVGDLVGDYREQLAALPARLAEVRANLADAAGARGNIPVRRDPPQPPARHRSTTTRSAGTGPADPALGKAARAVLAVLAEHDTHTRTKRQIALITGYSGRGGGFNNALSSLRSRGYITGSDPLTATDAGIAALGEYEPLPRGQALLDTWCARPQLGKAAKLALRALAGAYPNAVNKETLARDTGYEPSGGGFNNALSSLRTLELITDVTDDGGARALRAADELFD